MRTLTSLLVLICLAIFSNQQLELHGATLVNRGLDFHQGGLIPEDRMRSPLFAYTFNQGKAFSPPGRRDLRFRVPDQTTVTPQQTHLERYSSKLHFTYQETASYDIRGFEFSIGINTGVFGFGIGYGREWGQIKESLNSKYRATSKGLYRTSCYSVITIPHLFMPLDMSFKMFMDYLPTTPRTAAELELYQEFMVYYGGFFMYFGIFGGQIKTYSFLERVIAEHSNQKWVSDQIKLSFHYKLFELSGGGHRRRGDIKIDKSFAENTKDEIFFTGGIRSLQSNKTLREWDKSIDDAPGLLDGKFRPLSDLILGSPIKKQNMQQMIKQYSETGKVGRPSAALYVANKPKIPGYNVIGAGFDPSHMQTRLPIFVHENGGFDQHTTWTNPFYKEHSFAVPSTVYLRQNTGSLETNFTDVAMTKSQFESEYSRKWTSKSFFTRRTTTVYNYHRRNDLLGQVKITHEKQINWYDLMLNPSVYWNPDNLQKYMHPNLKTLINILPTDEKSPKAMELYRLLIEYWGTHLVIGAKMGGKVEQEVYFKKELLEHHSINKIHRERSFSFFGIINTRNYDRKGDEKIAKWYKDNVEEETKFTGGRYRPNIGKDNVVEGFGRFKTVKPKRTDTPWEEFVKTLRSDPGVLKYDVVPISTLIRDPAKKRLMDVAVNAYVKEMSVMPKATETEKQYFESFIDNLAKK